MLGKSDIELAGVIRFFSARGLEAGYLVPTDTGLDKSIMDAHSLLSAYLRKSGLHDYSSQAQGSDAKVILPTWIVKQDQLVATKSSLYRPETKSGDPRIWIYDLTKHVEADNLLALFAHEGALYVVNCSEPGLLACAEDPASPFSHVLDLLAAAKDKPLDDRFSEWNLRLLRSFFSAASKGEEVFLRVDATLLDQVGQDIGGDAGFLEAVRAGPPWIARCPGLTERITSLATQRALKPKNYKDPGDFDLAYRGKRAPAYLPYLAALVRNGAEHPERYYGGLRDDLLLDLNFGPQDMARVERAWEDLEKWTNETGGSFGRFKVRTLGGYSRIGVPRSQSILHQSDVDRLPYVFVQAEVRAGHEVSEAGLSRIMSEASARGGFTAAFASALQLGAFEQPIRAAIKAAHADWDGSLPRRTPSGEPSGAVAPIGLGIALSIIGREPLALAPHWRLPPLQDEGGFRLTSQSMEWIGHFSGTEGATSERSDLSAGDFWKLVAGAKGAAIGFEIRLDSDDGSDAEPLSIELAEHQLWILVPKLDGEHGLELREGELPGSGPAFLLAPPRNAGKLRDYLERQAPPHEILRAVGLPEDWLLARLDECAVLSDEQRLLPDGADGAHPRPRAIRFTGGRSIRRGYNRMYLPYDLPEIELDASEGAQLSCAGGIELVELEFAGEVGVEAGRHFKPLRRFKVKLAHGRGASYEIMATQRGQLLGYAKLRIADMGGELVDLGQPFSLDTLGRPIASHEGLSGVQLGEPLEEGAEVGVEERPFAMASRDLGSRADPADPHTPQEFFLDRLAISGGMDFATAKALLRRLMDHAGADGEPVHALLELRSLGHLEIATTQKGHMSRIHPVAPCVYELPACHLGRSVHGVAGTLRLAQREAITIQSKAWEAFRVPGRPGATTPWRLVEAGGEPVATACNRLGLAYAGPPGLPIATWSASLDTVREQYFRNSMESVGVGAASARRFNPAKGRFTARPSSLAYELWRLEDLDTGLDKLYVLANEGKFAFIRDSRWGVWMAMDAFAGFVAALEGMADVHPMPLVYAGAGGTLWLPARISLPSVLERALVACSGQAPLVVEMRPGEVTGDGHIKLIGQDGSAGPSVNRFYQEMAAGKWLGYRWVPQGVASEVARKLGAVLDEI